MKTNKLYFERKKSVLTGIILMFILVCTGCEGDGTQNVATGTSGSGDTSNTFGEQTFGFGVLE